MIAAASMEEGSKKYGNVLAKRLWGASFAVWQSG